MYIQGLNIPKMKEIKLPKIESVPTGDSKLQPFVFEYKGKPDEINDFVRLTEQVGLNAEIAKGKRPDGILLLKMSFTRDQFNKFIEVLHKMEIDR
jgi:hypothetical protein